VAVVLVDMLALGVQADAKSPHPQRVYPAVVAEVVQLIARSLLQGLTAVELVFLVWGQLGQQVLTVIRLPPVVMDREETTVMAVAVLVGPVGPEKGESAA
jgi:uracil DNA glycosylase